MYETGPLELTTVTNYYSGPVEKLQTKTFEPTEKIRGILNIDNKLYSYKREWKQSS